MKFLIILAVVPCIWAFNESRVTCPDESYCEFGKTCCAESDEYSCCDLAEQEKDNKKLIIAFPSHFHKNDSKIFPDNNTCSNGTICDGDWCCDYDRGECCENSTMCCPESHSCCGTATSPPHVWCCKANQRCAESYLYCIAGASSISSTFLSLIMMLVIAVSLKHY